MIRCRLSWKVKHELVLKQFCAWMVRFPHAIFMDAIQKWLDVFYTLHFQKIEATFCLIVKKKKNASPIVKHTIEAWTYTICAIHKYIDIMSNTSNVGSIYRSLIVTYLLQEWRCPFDSPFYEVFATGTTRLGRFCFTTQVCSSQETGEMCGN